MSPPALPAQCPKCESTKIQSHCASHDSHTCDLIRCVACGGTGTPDGRLWDPKPRGGDKNQ